MSAVRFHPKAPPLWVRAGVAQLAEQLICNQQVVGSIPITSSTSQLPHEKCGVKIYSGGLQSGQMHQTVNLTSPTSVVRIHLLPPATGTDKSQCLLPCVRICSIHPLFRQANGVCNALPRSTFLRNGGIYLHYYILYIPYILKDGRYN